MSMIASKILHYLHAELIWETQLLGASATIQAAAGCSQTVAEPSSAMPWHTSVLPQASSSFNSAAPHLHCPLSTGPSSPGSHAVSHCPSLATCQPPQHSLPSAVTAPSDVDAMDTDAAMAQDSISSQAEQQYLGGTTYAHMARDKLEDAAREMKRDQKKQKRQLEVLQQQLANAESEAVELEAQLHSTSEQASSASEAAADLQAELIRERNARQKLEKEKKDLQLHLDAVSALSEQTAELIAAEAEFAKAGHPHVQ